MVNSLSQCLVVCLLVVGCGGHKHDDTTAEEHGPSVLGVGGGPVRDDSANMIPPEKMDEVNQNLKRKNPVISRCLANAMENKDVPKGTRGKVTLEIMIAPSGHASSVKVIKSDITADVVLNCVKKHVEEIAFPEFQKQYETSYTYSMEAN
ncbi:MAG: hypothetical protein JWO36_1651 [Myxococcales bacterium]|nr:hypothetical protein [Myxococcales bacterium]